MLTQVSVGCSRNEVIAAVCPFNSNTLSTFHVFAGVTLVSTFQIRTVVSSPPVAMHPNDKTNEEF